MGQHSVRVGSHLAKNDTVITPHTYALAITTGYVALIVGAEVLSALGWVTLGVVIDLVIVAALLNHYAWSKQTRYRRALPIIALVPLMRVLSWTMATRSWPQVTWYAVVGAAMLMAVVLAARFLDLPPIRPALRVSPWQGQLRIAASGVPVGLGAFLLLRPQPLFANLSVSNTLIGVLVLIGSVGLPEELLFRGLLQREAVQAFGDVGLWVSSCLFVAVYISSLSVPYVIFMALVGVFFGWCVKRTGSIWGVVLAHSIWVIEALLVCPALWH